MSGSQGAVNAWSQAGIATARKRAIFGMMSEQFDWPEFSRTLTEEMGLAGFEPECLSETSAGPLLAWERPSKGPRIYLSAGMHGDEPAGPLAVLELLREGFFKPTIHWLVCPALNPTGLASCRRENACAIDLNRDYLIRRTPEVSAHVRWLDSRPAPELFLSLHEDWETSGFYFYEINLGVDDPQRARGIIAATEPWFEAQSGSEIDGHEPREPGWIYHPAEPDLPEGWPEAIYLAKLGCPLSFTFETPSRADLPARVAAHVAAVKAASGGILKTCL